MAKQFRSLWARLFHAFVVACYTPVRISIALTIRSLDPTLGLRFLGFGVSINLPPLWGLQRLVRSAHPTGLRKKETEFSRKKGVLSHSLFAHLIGFRAQVLPEMNFQTGSYGDLSRFEMKMS